MKYEVYDGTVPNPTTRNVNEATAVYKEKGCDSLISLGGGSSHDCCKGVGLLISNGGKIQDYEGIDKSTKRFPPYVAVNTTAGTAYGRNVEIRKNLVPCSFIESNARAIKADRHSMIGTCTHVNRATRPTLLQNWPSPNRRA